MPGCFELETAIESGETSTALESGGRLAGDGFAVTISQHLA